MLWTKVIIVLVAVKLSSSKTTSRALEGYPVGYLSDCPGSNKEARISKKSLKHLSFIHVNNSNIYTNLGKKLSYNYHRMQELSDHLDFSKKTVLYVGGYLDSNYYVPVSTAMSTMYAKLGYNTLSLEYITFTAMVYPKAVRFLRPVGKRVGEMLAELTKHGLNPKNLQLLGLSHGGQAVSFIAKSYRQITGQNISRVTSLDPSGPCFRNMGPEDRIDASDADFVDIIHTNIDGYGMAASVGHVDFYVNGGEYQPGDFQTLPCTNFCSHSRSYTLWLAALVNPNSFIGIQCDSIQDARDHDCFKRTPVVMNMLGPNVDRTKEGIFYVMTGNTFPYAMGDKGLKKKNVVSDVVLSKYNGDDVAVI